MMELKQCFFERWEKKSIFDILDVEYAPHRKNAAENLAGDNGFWSKFGAQNVENLDFLSSFENFHIQLHHISEWAKSDKNSKIWLILRSER